MLLKESWLNQVKALRFSFDLARKRLSSCPAVTWSVRTLVQVVAFAAASGGSIGSKVPQDLLAGGVQVAVGLLPTVGTVPIYYLPCRGCLAPSSLPFK